MNKLNEKCILRIKEIIEMEELLIKKCRMYSEICGEPLTKTLCVQNSAIHKNHYMALKSILDSQNHNSQKC